LPETIVFVTHSVDEAIHLGSKIAALTYRPGTVKRDLRVQLPRARDSSEPEFNKLKRELAPPVMAERQRFAGEEVRGA